MVTANIGNIRRRARRGSSPYAGRAGFVSRLAHLAMASAAAPQIAKPAIIGTVVPSNSWPMARPMTAPPTVVIRPCSA